MQLGRNGKINQTMKARGLGSSNGVLDYVVSFSVGAQSIECANNRTALNVALRDSRDFNVSRLIYLQQNSMWERHSLKLPQMGGDDEFLHIHVQSLGNATCWPLIDAFSVNTNPMPIWYDGMYLPFSILITKLRLIYVDVEQETWCQMEVSKWGQRCPGMGLY